MSTFVWLRRTALSPSEMVRGTGKAHAKGKARGKAKASRPRGSMTVAQKAMQNIRENMGHLSDPCCYVMVLAASGLTLFQQLQKDIESKAAGADIKFGPTYYEDLTMSYAPDDSVYASLKPSAADDSVVDPKLLEAAFVYFVFDSSSFPCPCRLVSFFKIFLGFLLVPRLCNS